MSAPGTVAVTGLGLWLPGFPNAAAWAAGAADPEAVKPIGAALDRVNRRRASPLDRALADTVAAAILHAGVDPTTVPVVVGSSIGEAATMIGLLDEMWRHHNPMSPADFTMSVHNAASGLISISNKNRGMTTSIAADHDTPAAALLEGIGLVLTRGAPVVVACGDEPAPPTLVQHAPPWSMLTAAVVLAPFAEVRIVPERFPVKSRLHGGWKGLAFNTCFVGTFNALPRAWVRPLGWHLMAFCRK